MNMKWSEFAGGTSVHGLQFTATEKSWMVRYVLFKMKNEKIAQMRFGITLNGSENFICPPFQFPTFGLPSPSFEI